jgi:uncharacterized RDD family membrane protein YckC
LGNEELLTLPRWRVSPTYFYFDKIDANCAANPTNSPPVLIYHPKKYVMENNDLILDEQFHEEKPADFELASRGKRFANFIIDRIMFYVFFFALAALVGVVFGQESLAWLAGINRFEDILITSFFLFIYYLLSESLMNGRTVGKFITRTRAVDEYGNVPDFATTLKRSACRLVPFDGLSFLGGGTGWHDDWSGTRVVEIGR